MKRQTISLGALVAAAVFSLSACSGVGTSLRHGLFGGDAAGYSRSGSLLLSFPLPERSPASMMSRLEQAPANFAPLLGYFPSRLSKLPASNEVWLELDRQEQRLRVYQGKDVLEDLLVDVGAGAAFSTIEPGQYLVQSKQKSPRWYAGDTYFSKRGLAVPAELSESRYLKGALGSQALFLSESFAIHSSPVWTAEVGGVCVEKAAFARVFDEAPIGVSVFIR